MRKLPKDRVYDMLERTNKVEAEKTELSAEKVELSDVRSLQTAMGLANSAEGVLQKSWAKVDNSSRLIRQAMTDYDDEVEVYREAIFAGLNEAMKKFAANAKKLGVNPSDVPAYNKAETELKMHKKILREYGMKQSDVNAAIQVLRKV